VVLAAMYVLKGKSVNPVNAEYNVLHTKFFARVSALTLLQIATTVVLAAMYVLQAKCVRVDAKIPFYHHFVRLLIQNVSQKEGQSALIFKVTAAIAVLAALDVLQAKCVMRVNAALVALLQKRFAIVSV
jgi:hypothetical protein